MYFGRGRWKGLTLEKVFVSGGGLNRREKVSPAQEAY